MARQPLWRLGVVQAGTESPAEAARPASTPAPPQSAITGTDRHDQIVVELGGGPQTVTLGGGRDLVHVDWEGAFDGPTGVVITDFVPGRDGDVLDLFTVTSAGAVWPGFATPWQSTQNPFAQGYVRLVQSGSDTVLQGRASLDASFVDLATFANTTATSFSAANFGGVNPYPGTITHGTHALDYLEGTSGADEIWTYGSTDQVRAGDGDDIIVDNLGGYPDDTGGGSREGDGIDGGAGNDVIRGGGNILGTTLGGGEGSDVIFGGNGNDVLSGDGGGITSTFHPPLDWDPYGWLTFTFNAAQRDDDAEDTLFGGAGDDLVYLRQGDNAFGGDGYDQLTMWFGFVDTGVTAELSSAEGQHLFGQAIGSDIAGFESFWLLATDFDDHISVSGNTQLRIEGGAGRDTLIGGDNADDLSGYRYRGYYYLADGRGVYQTDDAVEDVLIGGAGNDEFVMGVGDRADGGAHTDNVSVHLWTLDRALSLDLRVDPFAVLAAAAQGSIENMEAITGVALTAHDDVIWTGIARDIFADGGDDLVHGGDGRQYIWGDDGDDRVYGGGDVDTIRGGAGDDQLFGEAGNDVLYGDTTHLPGRLPEPSGADLLDGGDGADRLIGGLGDDILRGGAGDDVLEGGDGADWLAGNAGTDIARGGAGDDLYVVSSATDQTVELGDEGWDTVQSWVNWTLADNLESLVLLGEAKNGWGNSLLNHLTGNDHANYLNGRGGADVLRGGGGSDTLVGEAGDDHLIGNAGDDLNLGGLGDDLYTVSSAGDQVIEKADEGHDTVQSWVNWTLWAHIEDLELLGQARNGWGNSSDNRLTGNSLGNYLNGLAGDDVVLGMAGDDVLLGREGDDVLLGGDGDDRLEGGAGYDVLAGGAGDDLYILSGTDGVVEATGGGHDTVHAWTDHSLWWAVEDLVLLGAARHGRGNGLDNNITGNGSTNEVNGLGGADTLTGAGGNDIFIFTGDFGGDTVTDFSAGEGSGDRIRLETSWMADFAEVLDNATDTADGLVIARNGLSITLTGVTRAQLNADDFQFVAPSAPVAKYHTPLVLPDIEDLDPLVLPFDVGPKAPHMEPVVCDTGAGPDAPGYPQAFVTDTEALLSGREPHRLLLQPTAHDWVI